MNEVELYNKIIGLVGPSDYYKGRDYFENYIEFKNKVKNNDNSITYKYKVESERTYKKYNCDITIKNDNVKTINCNCPQCNTTGHCKHIAAVLYNHLEQMHEENTDPEEKMLSVTETILNMFDNSNKNQTRRVKEQVKLEVELYPHSSYYHQYIEVKLKIGTGRMYSLNNKINTFLDAYNNPGIITKFGKEFTYDSSCHYFNNEDSDILNFFIKQARTDYYGNVSLNQYAFNLKDNQITKFFELLENKQFTVIGHGKINGIISENPFKTTLSKREDGKYIFNIDLGKQIIMPTDKHVIYKDKLYKLDNKTSKIISELIDNKTDTLMFTEEQLSKFTSGVLPIFKSNINLDKSVDIVIANDPVPKLYFDLMYSKIICNLKFDYNDNLIEYFDNSNNNIVRNQDFEEEVVNDILKYNFVMEDKKIFLSDIDLIGNFLENDLQELTEKYDTFTSQKIKDTSIIKKTNVSSQFTIGQDNIMSYTFDMDGIETGEIFDIFESMKQRKKYFKLKNGDFIDIENNENLNQLQNLVNDMDLSNSDIKKGTGVIPKYRAIYLDSLKNSKYDIIKTNNMFDELIKNFNTYKDAPVDLSKKDLKILRDYQVTGVKWLTNIHRCGFGGILADEMGLGKSIQVIYFIKQLLKENKDAKILIVSPTSLIYNWSNEFDKFGNELKYKVIASNKNDRVEILKNMDDTNIYITTYGLLRQDEELYSDIKFETCIIDEAQNIKNVNAGITKVVKKVNANTKIALSGTPIENSVLELWSIFDFIMPGYLSNLNKFKSKYNVKDITEEDLKIFDDLNKQISAFILRRKKSDVILELPDKLENNIYLDLLPEQKKLYISQVNKTRKEMDEAIQEEGFMKARFKILQLLTRLRQICIDPKIVFENYEGGSCKMDNLVNIVKDTIKNGHKILIFTSYKTALEIAKEKLNSEGVKTYVIAGDVSAKKRMELVDKFNNDDTNVFLIMLKAGGTGLNLTSADVVIHLDLWWNPQVENQATDRAHRIGQKNTVEVIKLICKGTIEERIIELQNKKKILSDSLIDGKNRDENMLSTLSEKDLKALIAIDNEDE